jgi:acyl carrier protein
MQPDTTRIWTSSEIGVSVGKILAESLGTDEATIAEEMSLVRDLGAESIDFLDISFKCQQTFGVDLPARLIQDRLVEWQGLGVLSKVVQQRYGVPVAAEELRTIAPATIPAVLQYLEARHGISRTHGDDRELAGVLAARLLNELDGIGLDLSDLTSEALAVRLLENLHSPNVLDELLDRFTVRALVDYFAGQLAKASRLATGA